MNLREAYRTQYSNCQAVESTNQARFVSELEPSYTFQLCGLASLARLARLLGVFVAAVASVASSLRRSSKRAELLVRRRFACRSRRPARGDCRAAV